MKSCRACFFTAGVRYAHDAVLDAYYNTSVFTGANPNQQNKVPSINSTKTTPRVVLRYKLTDDSNVYASYTEGTRPRFSTSAAPVRTPR